MRLNLVVKLWRLARKHKRASRFYLAQLQSLQARHDALLRQKAQSKVVQPVTISSEGALTETEQAVLNSYRDQARDAGLDASMGDQWFEAWRKLERV